jgi:hypothetical protein
MWTAAWVILGDGLRPRLQPHSRRWRAFLALNSRQFFAILEACTDKLPAVQGRLFLMRASK